MQAIANDYMTPLAQSLVERARAMISTLAARARANRAEAIAEARAALQPGDVLAVAGKGHEQGQTIGTETFPFDDAAVVRQLIGIT